MIDRQLNIDDLVAACYQISDDHAHFPSKVDVLIAMRVAWKTLDEYLQGRGQEEAAPPIYGLLSRYVNQLTGEVIADGNNS